MCLLQTRVFLRLAKKVVPAARGHWNDSFSHLCLYLLLGSDAAQCARTFTEHQQEGVDIARVENTAVVVEVNAVAGC